MPFNVRLCAFDTFLCFANNFCGDFIFLKRLSKLNGILRASIVFGSGGVLGDSKVAFLIFEISDFLDSGCGEVAVACSVGVSLSESFRIARSFMISGNFEITGEKMTVSAQTVNVSVVGKKTTVAKYGVGSNVDLKEASVIQLHATRAEVREMTRKGGDLVVTMNSGEVVTVKGYFQKLEGGKSALTLDDDLEGMWQANMGDPSDTGVLPFGFTSIQSIDPLLADTGESDDRDAVLGAWHAALGALTVGAMIAGGTSHGGPSVPVPEPTTEDVPLVPIVKPVNGVNPIVGVTTPGATVTVVLPDGTTRTGVAGADGIFSIANPGLKHNDEITLHATNHEGVNSASTKVTVDALAPDAPTVDPVNGTSPLVGHAEPNSTVTITLPDGKTETIKVGADGNFQLANPGFKDGDKIFLTATDAAGNVSDKTEVTVDALPPTLTISDNVPGVLSDSGTVTFTFTFTEAVKGFDASKIHLENGTAGKFVAVSNSVYTLEVTPASTGSGVIKVSVDAGAALDGAGNPSVAAEATQSYGSKADTTAPGPDSVYDVVLMDDVGPVQGPIHNGDKTDDAKPTYMGKADASDVAKVQIYDNGKLIGSATVQSDGSWSFEPKTPLASGAHSFQLRPVDAAGNVGDLNDAITFELYGAGPAAPLITRVYDDVGSIVGTIKPNIPTDDKQPTLEGTAKPGTVVNVYDGSNLVGTAKVGSDGLWSIITSELGEGTHKLTATAVDDAGQVSPPSAEYQVLVDTTAPGQPAIPNLTGSHGEVPVGQGTSSAVVDITNPAFSGKGEAGAKVVITDNGIVIGETTVNEGGQWTYVPKVELSEGKHEVHVTLTDQAGNTSKPSDDLTFTVDTSKVELSILRALDDVGPLTAPVLNAGATDDPTPTLEGKGPAGVTVSVYEGNTLLGSAQVDANGLWSLALPDQSDGKHLYVAKANNAAGTALEAQFTLTVDTTPSSVPIINGIGDDAGTKQTTLTSGESTDDTTPTIHGSGTAGDQINIYDNGKLIGTTTVGNDGTWQHTVDPALTTEGEHALTATSVDPVGNESAPGDEFIIVLDTTPPDISNVRLSIDKVAGDDYVNIEESKGSVTLTGHLSNVPEDVVSSKILVTVNGTVFEASLSGDTWSVGVPGSVLVAGGEGKATLDVRAVLADAAGNEANVQITHDYGVKTTHLPEDWEKVAATLWDDVEPVVGEITSGTATNDSKPVYKGVAESSAGVSYVEVLDGGKVIGVAQVQGDGSWSFEPDQSLLKGEHHFQARPADIAGNSGTPTNVIDFSVQGPQPQPPAIEDVRDDVGPIVGNIQKGVPTDDTTPTLSGTAESGTVVKIFDVVNGELVQVGSTKVVDGLWRVDTSTLSDGEHHLVATATDGAGQESARTGEYLVLVDSTAPLKSQNVQAIDHQGDKIGPLENGATTDDPNPELRGKGEAGTTVDIYDNGKNIGSTVVDKDGIWSFTPPVSLDDAAHSITVTLTDKAGNVSEPSDALTFTVNTEGLALIIQQVLDDFGPIQRPIVNGGRTDDTTPTFVGKATAGSTVLILEGSQQVASVVADDNGNWRVSLPEQGEGAHQYIVKAQSTTGNEATAHFDLSIDTTAPDVPSITGVADDVGIKQSLLVDGGVTDDTTPTVTGKGVAGDTIKIFDNGTLVGSAVVGDDGNWSYTVNPAFTNEGRHELTATAVDDVGNESSASNPFAIVLDVTPPDVSKVQVTVNPVTDDNVINAAESKADVTLTGRITGAPSDVTETTVDVVINGAHYQGVLGGDTWQVSVPGSALLADSDHQIEITARFMDAAGNSAQKNVVQTYGVDVVGPDIDKILFTSALMDDVGDKQGEIHSGDITDDNKPRYVGQTDASEVAKVRVFNHGQLIGEASVASDGSWWVEPVTPLAAGAHSFQVHALDAAGNESKLTTPLDFTVAGPAPQAPSITGVYDDAHGNIQPNHATNDATPMFEGTAALGTVVKLYDVSDDGTRVLVGTATVDGQGNWSASTQNLPDGLHKLIATAVDGAGQESVATGIYPVQVDTVAPPQPDPVQAFDNVGDKTGLVASGDTTDDSTPEFKGSGESGATVRVYDKGELVGTTTVGEDGQWSLNPPKALVEGEHIITVTLTDSAGNSSTPSEALKFNVGLEGIELLIEQVLDDVGPIQLPVANGGSTDDTTPTFVGRATAGATVSIFEGNQKLASAVADGKGIWTIALPEQGEGAHEYTVNALSLAGNEASAKFGLTVDTTAPSVPTITGVTDDVGTKQAPLTDGGVTDDTTPTITGKAGVGETVKVFDNGSYVGSTVVGADGNWAYTVNPALTNEGRHELTATAVDAVGNESSASNPFAIVLDVTPPDVSKVQLTINPVTDDNVINAAEQTTTITLTGTLANLPADVDQSSVVVRVNDVAYNAVLKGTTWSVDVPGSALVADADHVVQVTATFSDAAGNTAQRDTSGSYAIKLQAPSAGSLHDIVVWDDVGETQGPIHNNDSTDDKLPLMSGNADQPEVAKVQVLDNGVLIGVASVAGDGKWSFTPDADLTVGSHSLQFRPIDGGGNIGDATAALDFNVAGDAPTPPIIGGLGDETEGGDEDLPVDGQPVEIAPFSASVVTKTLMTRGNLMDPKTEAAPVVSALYTNNTTPTLKGTATPGTLVKLYDTSIDGSRVLVGSTTASLTGAWSVTTTKLSESSHNFIATSTDLAGQISAPSVAFTLIVDITPPAKPMLPQIMDNAGDARGELINGGVTDDTVAIFTGVGEVGAKVKIYDNGKLIATAVVGSDGSWNYQPTTPLAEGAHSIRTTLTDKANNVSAPSDALNFTVDTTPAALTIKHVTDDVGSIRGDLASGGATDDASPTFSGESTAGAKISISEAGKVVASTTADSNGHWSVDLPAQADGDHKYTVQSVNAAGNIAKSDFSLSVDTIASSIPKIVSVTDDFGAQKGALASGAVTDDTTPTLAGTATAGDTVKVYDNGHEIGSVTANGKGEWSYTVEPAFAAEGSHALSVTSIDAVGNESEHSPDFLLRLDTTPPSVSNAKLTINNITDDNVVNQAESQGPVTLTGTLTGVPADSVNTKVVVYVNGAEYKATLDGDTWHVDVRGTALINDSDHKVEVKATFTDEAGNAAELLVDKVYQTKSEPPVVTSVYGTTLIDDVGDIQGPILNGGITDDHKPTYSGKATTPEVSVVQILDGGNVIGEAQVKADGSWSFEPVTDLLAGNHKLQARPVDFAGNVGTATADISFEVAGDAPNSPIISGVDDDGGDESSLTIDLRSAPIPTTDSVGSPEVAGAEQPSPVTFAMPLAAAISNFPDAPQLMPIPVPKALPVVITNDSTPTLKGSATAGTNVKLYVMDTADKWVLVGTAVADAAGKWSVPVTTELSEGTHRFMATSTDAYGQVSAPSVEFLLQVDVTAPLKIDSLHAWDDVGAIQGEIVNGSSTDDTLPLFKGSGEPGAKVSVYDKGVVIGTAVVGADGQWSIQTTTALPDGAHVITATQKDAAGNVSQVSDKLNFTVDTVAPQATSTMFYLDNVGRAQGQFASGTSTDDRTPSLLGKLTAPLEPGVQVAIYEGDHRLGTAVLNGTDWTFTLPDALTNGTSHNYIAKVVDAAGNSSTAAELNLSVALSMGVQSQTTRDTTPLIVGTLGAELLPGEHLEVTVNGTNYSSKTGAVAVDTQNGIWYLQIPDGAELAQGSNQVVSQLMGAAGDVVLRASGSVGIEAGTGTSGTDQNANTNWAVAPGDPTNNTLVYGLNGDGLWTIAANRHVYSSTDLSSYTSSVLGNLQGQPAYRTVVSMTSADYDRNGTADVFGTENKYDCQYQIMWNNTGNGYASQKLSLGCGAIFWGAVIAYDKTGDGYLDLAYGDRYGDSVVYMANKNGKLTPDTNSYGNAGMNSCYQKSFGEVSGVDINGDGTVDIARHDLAKGCYTLSIINNNGSGKLTPGQSIANVFYANEFNSVSTASMTWADFNGDGKMDLYLASGYGNSSGMIYYNNGAGQLSTSGVSIEMGSRTLAPKGTGYLSVATDWNHDGKMDVIKFSPYGASQTATLYTNNGAGAWTPKVLSSSLSNVTGIASMDYNWDGAKDLIVSQQNGKIAYIQNNEKIAAGTAMHLHIVDSEGINVYYGNTVQLFDSTGKLAGAQILNAQSGYGVNDTSGLVSFYGLDPSQTYTAKLLKVTNGVSSNVSWNGLEASDGTDAYMLTATAATGVKSAALVGTGYNDTFIAEAGSYTYNGSGGWTGKGESAKWSASGGLDIVDFRNATSGVTVDMGASGFQGNASMKAKLVDIEGISGSNFDDTIKGTTGNDWLEGRGGADNFNISNGGKDSLIYKSLNMTDATGGNGSDVVTGFKVGSWEAMSDSDRIDLHELLEDYHPASGGAFAAKFIDGVATIDSGDSIANYLRVQKTAQGTEIQVDRHGDGTDYATLLTLVGVQTDLATLLANHQLTVV